MSHNNQKKIAVINDFSGFGRCSIAVALPILSVMKVQCCPLPTSISNHTGFPSYFFEDYTSRMVPYMQEWKKLDLHFNGICSGFLGSKEQIEIVKKFFKEFKTFIERGNVIDLAVGVVIGSAFTNIVNSLVNDVITPTIGLIIGKIDFSNLVIPGTQIKYGSFINNVINFFIIAFCIFLIVKFINKLTSLKKKKEVEEKKEEPKKSNEEILLEEILNELKKNNKKNK